MGIVGNGDASHFSERALKYIKDGRVVRCREHTGSPLAVETSLYSESESHEIPYGLSSQPWKTPVSRLRKKLSIMGISGQPAQMHDSPETLSGRALTDYGGDIISLTASQPRTLPKTINISTTGF